jgi:hypothetical protein
LERSKRAITVTRKQENSQLTKKGLYVETLLQKSNIITPHNKMLNKQLKKSKTLKRKQENQNARKKKKMKQKRQISRKIKYSSTTKKMT